MCDRACSHNAMHIDAEIDADTVGSMINGDISGDKSSSLSMADDSRKVRGKVAVTKVKNLAPPETGTAPDQEKIKLRMNQ